LADIGLVIAVAGGQSKAEAIIAVTNAGGQDVLVTDESAAKAIQSII
jgi:central glycolytic genes regulator